MAFSINGSTGISGLDGSAATPAIKGTDADSGVFFGTDTASIATAGHRPTASGSKASIQSA